MFKKETLAEIIRFGIVGTLSTVMHYTVYWVLQHWIEVNTAYTLGYFLSFLVNYLLSARFTFHGRVSARSGAGFSGAHLVNYALHIVLLNFFLWLCLFIAALFGLSLILIFTFIFISTFKTAV